MEPDNTNSQKDPIGQQNITSAGTNDDLHAEGIDIMSGVAEENEFTEKNSDLKLPGAIEVEEKPPVAPTPVPTPVRPTPPPPPPQKTSVVPPRPPAPPKPPTPPTDAPASRISMTFDDVLKQAKTQTAPKEIPQKDVPPPEVMNDPSIRPLRTFKTDAESILGPKAPAPPPRPQAPKPEPIPLTREQEKPKNDPSTKPIRTFKTDAEERVKYQNVSVVDIAVAAQKKNEETGNVKPYGGSHSGTAMFIISVLAILVLLAGGWYYWFTVTQSSATERPPAEIKTLISYSKGAKISLGLDEEPLVIIASKLQAGNAGLGNVYALLPTENASSSTLLSINSIFKNTSIPGKLSRSLEDTSYMFGTYSYDTNSPFIILKNTFFQNAFAGMLEWEKTLRADLLPLIKVVYPNETLVATGLKGFEDSVVSNIDTRILKNAEGNVILAYAFSDKDTIVITTSVNSLKYILDRLLMVRTIQ